jgi:2-polyprenyl-6-methoxyphenol hydroxylase-like FAD-dependent oxidoreductase
MVSGADQQVIIIGAGPTGLVLAAELGLAGVPCLVLERRQALRADSRAICLHARSMESLDLRGQARVLAEAGLPVPSFPLGPRRAVISLRGLDSDFPYILDIPQSEMERIFAAWAARCGAEIRWSSQVTTVEQDAAGVTATLESGLRIHGAYLVGCDGVHSLVRESAAVPFPGVPNPGTVVLADLYLDGLPMTDAYGDLSGGGLLLVFPYRDGSCRVVLYDYARADVPTDQPVTLDDVREGLIRIAGRDFGPRGMYWSRRYRSESRQAPAYRAGRVLLAGDAAHAHSPAGAQGLNTGLQDAMNLGWKLAAVVSGWAPGWLLDSYHSERHPVGAAVLALTGRQFRLNTARTPARRALRWAVHRLLVPLPPVQARLARDYSGVSIRYPASPVGPAAPAPPAAPAHPLAGARLPRGTLTLPDGRAERLYDLFRDGNFALVDAAPGALAPEALPGQVRLVRYAASTVRRMPAAMLVRPDGYIAWASDEADPAARAAAGRAAVNCWCAG